MSNVGAFVWKRPVILIIVAFLAMGSDRSAPRLSHTARGIKETIWVDWNAAKQAHDAIPEFALAQKCVRQFIVLRQAELHDPIADRRSLFELRETRLRADRFMRLLPIWLHAMEQLDQKLRKLSGSLYVAIHAGEHRSLDTERLRGSRILIAAMRQELAFARRIIEHPDDYNPTRTESYEPECSGNMELLEDLLGRSLGRSQGKTVSMKLR